MNQIVTHDSQNRSVFEEESFDCLTLMFKALRFWKKSLGLINLRDLNTKNTGKVFFSVYRPEGERSTIFRNVGTSLPINTNSHPRRRDSSPTPLREPQISHHLFSLQEEIFLSQRFQ